MLLDLQFGFVENTLSKILYMHGLHVTPPKLSLNKLISL